MKMDHLELPSIRFPDRLVFDDGQHRVELIKYGQATRKVTGWLICLRKVLFLSEIWL